MRLLVLPLAVLVLMACSEPASEQVFVYSARHYDSDTLLFDNFTQRTGIEVRVLQGGSDELIERMSREGIASPADVLITVDAGRLWRADQAGLLQPVSTELLEERVPAHLRHPQGHWFGFSQRLRVIFYDRESVDPDRVQRYEDLADPELGMGICVRSSTNVYNQSLLASMVSHRGSEAAAAWASGLGANLSRPPQGGDTDQILGVASGECELAVANHYYYVRLLTSGDPDRRAAADRVGIVFPNQADRGVHINVGGAGVARHAPNRANAVRLLEYLASDEAQALFAWGNHEYPVVPGVELDPVLQAWGSLRLDDLNVAELGVHNPEAVRIADRVGWR
ncbi:MAG: Fe(3+) ABC transporter substrate-binding protein [Gammaproteobacteria bacterium]|nr:MAG: Fe(3+) ABC transporter substrate-binding protein [Gammaproteobacteria bacterium]